MLTDILKPNKYSISRFLGILTVALSLCVACGKSGTKPPPEPPQPPLPQDVLDTLVILSTNDVHAFIDNMPKEAAYIQSMQKRYPRVLVLSAGDIFSGNPVVDQYQPRGYPMRSLMQMSGYQLMSLGNHDFDYGQEALSDWLAQASFPALCANADFSQSPLKDKVKPYKVLNVNGVKVVILGLIQMGGAQSIPSTAPSNVSGISFRNGVTEFIRYRSLRDSGAVFIVLSHLGIDADRQLAAQYPEIDMIIGGHSHTLLNPSELRNGVLITQSGSNHSHIGNSMLILRNGKLATKSSLNVPLNSLTAIDTRVQDSVRKYQNSPWLQRVIGQASSAITGKEALGSLMTDAMTHRHNLDLAFTNSGGIRVSSIPQGDITVAMVYELDPFENEVVVYDLSLAEITRMLQYACRYNETDWLISGGRYTWHTGSKTVSLVDYQGNPLRNDRRYLVGMNSYMAETYMNQVSTEKAGQSLFVTCSSTLIDYIEEMKVVAPQSRRTFIDNQ